MEEKGVYTREFIEGSAVEINFEVSLEKAHGIKRIRDTKKTLDSVPVFQHTQVNSFPDSLHEHLLVEAVWLFASYS